jgi:putative transposase
VNAIADSRLLCFHDTDFEIRQVKYLNNIVEQDHRAIKRMVSAMLGFKAFKTRSKGNRLLKVSLTYDFEQIVR